MTEKQMFEKIAAALEEHARKVQRMVDAQEGRVHVRVVNVRAYRVRAYRVDAHTRIITTRKKP